MFSKLDPFSVVSELGEARAASNPDDTRTTFDEVATGLMLMPQVGIGGSAFQLQNVFDIDAAKRVIRNSVQGFAPLVDLNPVASEREVVTTASDKETAAAIELTGVVEFSVDALDQLFTDVDAVIAMEKDRVLPEVAGATKSVTLRPVAVQQALREERDSRVVVS
jgi:hypothetical protein